MFKDGGCAYKNTGSSHLSYSILDTITREDVYVIGFEVVIKMGLKCKINDGKLNLMFVCII